MSAPAAITPAVEETIIAFLATLFLAASAGNNTAARHAAGAILATYGARTDRELRFAALSIAFGFGALEALSQASGPDLAMKQVLRLHGCANALNRAAQQNETRLEKLRKQPPVAAGADAPDALPVSGAVADLLAFARLSLTSMINTVAPAVPAMVVPAPVAAPSRQQRRAAERKAEKTRLRQAEETRLAQRAAQRATAAQESVYPRPDRQMSGLPSGPILQTGATA